MTEERPAEKDLAEYVATMTKMIEEHYNMTKDTMEMCNCLLDECFPYTASKKVEINGKTYRVRLNITFEEI